jgi:hypothetical protein
MSFVTFWTNHGSEVANGALVLSAIAAFAIIRSGRNVARRRGTLDLILHIESDRELIEAREKFIDLKVGSAKLDNFGMESEQSSQRSRNYRCRHTGRRD